MTFTAIAFKGECLLSISWR